MSITFTVKPYTCSECAHKGRATVVVKNNRDITTLYPEDRRPEEVKPDGIYTETRHRDEYGILMYAEIHEYKCEKCGGVVSADKVEEYRDVLNFYPPDDATKWYEGFIKHLG